MLSVDFVPEANDATGVLGLNFLVAVEAGNPARARLLIDGRDSGEVLAREDMVHFVAFRAFDNSLKLVQAMMDAKEASLEVTDAKGKLLRRYGWDIFPVRRIPELLELTHWNCRSPDRG